MSWRELLGVAESNVSPTRITHNTHNCDEATNSAYCADNAYSKSKSNAVVPAAPDSKPETRIPITCEAFEQRGFELLPEDCKFLLRYLPTSTARRNAIVREYQRRWSVAMTKEAGIHRKQNRGRFVANTWLRIESETWQP